MVKTRWTVGLLAGCLLLGGAAASAQTNTQVIQILQYQPRQPNIDFTTPTEAELAACEVKLITGSKQGSSGYLLLDARKKPLRRFLDSNGDKRIDVFSYYKDGFEVYREIDTDNNNKVDEFRWFNAGGMKWGIDRNEDGKIESWKTISEEELAQEAFQAVITRDFARLKALFITDAELQSLQLPANYSDKIRTQIQNAQAKFTETASKVSVPAGKKIVGRVESATPQCVPGESIGTDQDLYRHPSLSVLYEAANNRHEWLQTGEMVKVGNAWRLIDAPFTGDITHPGDSGDASAVNDPIIEEIAKLDQQNIDIVNLVGADPKVVNYYLKRVELIDKLLPKLKGSDLNLWQRQKADNLQAASLHSPASDSRAFTQLRKYRDQIAQKDAAGSLAGYVTYRALWSEYAPKLSSEDPNANLIQIQTEWMDKLASFVQSYPKADDAPDALIQLAMGSEFSGKEEEAKRYYGELAKNFPTHPLAGKAEGAIRRLNLVGNPIALAGSALNGQAFNITSLKGKVVAVYYWASYCTNCPTDFAKLNKLHEEFRTKGFEVVAVNLDDTADQAAKYLQATPLTGIHLHAPGEGGGMNSPLANQYGIMGLPTLFVVGKDGVVISRNIQINDLEDAIRKAQ